MSQQQPSTVNIICPRCKSVHQLNLSPHQSTYSTQCPKCQLQQEPKLVYIRAKNSQLAGRRKKNYDPGRKYQVRIIDFSGKESVIKFYISNSRRTLDLRNKDLVIFNYVNNKLALIQNITIDEYLQIATPADAIFSFIGYLFLALIVIFIIFLLSLF